METFIAAMGWYTIPFVLVLSILVFVHELGHFLVARYNGVGVTRFSIGFGPEIFGWVDSKGTRWRFAWIPVGGYVQMVGDADAASTPDVQQLEGMSQDQREKSLHHKTVWQRIAVSGAGPAANYLFAVVIFAGLFATVGQRYTAPIIEDVREGSAAFMAGLKKGDRFVSIEGSPVQRFEDIQDVVHSHADRPLKFEIARAGQTLEIMVTPKRSVIKDLFGTQHHVGLLGVVGNQSEYIRRPWYSALGYAVVETWDITKHTLSALYDVVVGTKSSDGLGGPLRIAQMSGRGATGVVALLWFMALLSVNLGLINLFPVPMLDGGHLFFYVIEAITGKPISPRTMEWAFRIGFVFIAGLMLLATWNDLSHILNF